MINIADTDTDIWDAILADTAYAGGGANGGAPSALDENSLVQGTDTLIAQDPVQADSSSFFMATADRNLEHDIGDDLYHSDDSTIAVPPAKASIVSHLVTDNWFDLAVSSGQGKGDIPLTWTHHIDNAEEELDWFGCWVDSLTIEAKANQKTLQTAECSSRGWKAGNAMNKVAYQSGARAMGANCTFTADSKTSATLISQYCRLTINNNINTELGTGLGDQRIQQPRLGKRTVEVEIRYLNRDSNTWTADVRNTTAQLVDITIVFHSTLTVTMTNLKPVFTNSHEVKKGIHQHVVRFENGAGFTIA